jgi:hypothetical protein
MTFYFEPTGALAERIRPSYGPRRQEYVHRCSRAVFEEVCHRVDEVDSFTLDEIVAAAGVPHSQAALALRFLHRFGLVERGHDRRCRRTEDSIHLSAMTCWHAEHEGATHWKEQT